MRKIFNGILIMQKKSILFIVLGIFDFDMPDTKQKQTSNIFTTF